VSHTCIKHYKGVNNLFTYLPETLGLKPTSLSALVALAFGEIMGCKEFKLYAFDSCFSNSLSYAKVIGYTPNKYGDPERFRSHRKMIETYCSENGLNLEFVKVP
jgi:hypothetical protein